MVVAAPLEAHDLRIADGIGVRDEDETVVLVRRAVGKAEQPTLAALLADAVGEVGKLVHLAFHDRHDHTIALSDDRVEVAGAEGDHGGVLDARRGRRKGERTRRGGEQDHEAERKHGEQQADELHRLRVSPVPAERPEEGNR